MDKEELKKIREEDKEKSIKYGNPTGKGTSEFFLIDDHAREVIERLIYSGHIREGEFELGLDIDNIITHREKLYCSVCNGEHIVGFLHSPTGIQFICKKCWNKHNKVKDNL